LREIGAWVEITVGVLLHQNTPSCIERGIYCHYKRAIFVRHLEDRGRDKAVLEAVESTLAFQ